MRCGRAASLRACCKSRVAPAARIYVYKDANEGEDKNEYIVRGSRCGMMRCACVIRVSDMNLKSMRAAFRPRGIKLWSVPSVVTRWCRFFSFFSCINAQRIAIKCAIKILPGCIYLGACGRKKIVLFLISYNFNVYLALRLYETIIVRV